MNELDLLRSLGDELDQAPKDARSDARQQVLDRIAVEGTAVRRPAPAAWSRPRSGLVVPAAAAVLVAALAIAVPLLVGPAGSTSGPPAGVSGAAGGSGSAAAVDPKPPAGQSFAYTRSRERGWTDPERSTRTGRVVDVPSKSFTGVRESWMSVDGTRDGGFGRSNGVPATVPTLSFPGCRAGRPVADPSGDPCVPDPAYQADLPTTVAAAREELRRRYPGRSADAQAAEVFDGIGELMMEKLMTPAARAVLREVASSTPGAVTAPGAIDGVTGLLVGLQTGKHQTDLLFDAQTDELLGRASGPAQPSGQVDTASAQGGYSQVVLERGVVTGFALRPDGTKATSIRP